MAEEIFGRDEELARVAALIDAIPDGFRALVLDGEAGIGKSTIWRWALARASNSSRRVLSCRPAERESELSYAAFGDLLDGVEESTLGSLPKPQRRAFARALLREDVTDSVIDPRALAYAFLTTLRLLAKTQPVLIAVDDAHWLDAPSARLLKFALRRLNAEPIGVLVMSRSGENAVEPLGLEHMLEPARLRQLQLGPLSVGAIHHIVHSQLGVTFPRSILVQLHQISQGNPFTALEISRFLQRRSLSHELSVRLPIPPTLIKSVEDRLACLSNGTQAVLLVVAALSQPRLSLVKAAVDRPDLVESQLQEAVGAGIIEITDQRIRFTHPLLAAAHYGAATEVQRRALHTRLATVVDDVEERASHLAQGLAEPGEEVALALDRAAASAQARGAPEVAARLAEHASRLTPPEQTGALWRRTSDAAMCHYLSGQSNRARLLWEEIVAKAPPGPIRAAARWRLTEFRDTSLDVKTQIEVAAAALDEAGSDLGLRAAINFTLANTLLWGGDIRGARPYASAAVELAERKNDSVALALALHAAAWVEFLSGRGIPTSLIDRSLALEDKVRHLPLETNPRMGWAMMLAYIGEDVETARRELTGLRSLAEEFGYEVSLPLLLWMMSDLECRAGNWKDAERYANECHEVAQATDQHFRLPLALCAKAILAARRGQLEVASKAGEEAHSLAARVGPWYVEARTVGVLGLVALAAGRPDLAHRWLAPLVERERAAGYAEPTSLRCLPDEIEALIALRDFAAAGNLIDFFEDQGRRHRRAWALAIAARCRGQLAGAQGDLVAARTALEAAVVEHGRLPDPFELARTLLVLGNVCRRARQKRAAKESLERAAAIFVDLGAMTWAAQAREELERVAVYSPGVANLSPTEERVAELVAQGRTNKEIAQALFMSVKSVEANLTRIYSKLGVRSRTELALHVTGDAQPAEI